MVGVLGRRAARRILRRDSPKTGRRGTAPTDDAASPRRTRVAVFPAKAGIRTHRSVDRNATDSVSGFRLRGNKEMKRGKELLKSSAWWVRRGSNPGPLD